MGALNEAAACDSLSEEDEPYAKARLRAAITRHIRRNPNAADTARGVAKWWLPSVGYETAPDSIAAVLEEMAEGGLLQALLMPDGEILYRRRDGG